MHLVHLSCDLAEIRSNAREVRGGGGKCADEKADQTEGIAERRSALAVVETEEKRRRKGFRCRDRGAGKGRGSGTWERGLCASLSRERGTVHDGGTSLS